MEVAVVGAVVGAVVTNLVSKLSAVIDKRFSEFGDLEDDIRYLKTELAIIAAKINDQHKGQQPSVLQNISTADMRDLAFDIEDCLDQFLPCAACKRGAVSKGDLVDFAIQVGKLKKRLGRGQQQRTDNAEPADQVGIEEPKQEILGLLGSEKLLVISIVGFGGSGKTQLARAVFDCDEAKEKFGARAWHTASEHKDGHELLLAILQKLFPKETLLSVSQMQSQVSRLQQRIRFEKTRCLIVVDDIEKHHWEAIKSFFSETRIIRILVTTTVQTVAKACTKDHGYIYNMRTLSVGDSKDLLKKWVGDFNRNSTDLEDGSAAIVRKCHGHPLALISVANYLLQQEQITGAVCQNTSRLLCTHMDENKHGDFTKLRQILVNNYINLPFHLKTCLLYTSLFPNDRPVSTKTLTSRWLAEGYIKRETERTYQESADEKLEQLMDRNIIRPVDTSNRGEKKTCKPHGIMHQFMLYKSISSNFVAPSLENRGNFRHIMMDNQRNRRETNMDHGAAGPAAHRPNQPKNFFRFLKPSKSTVSKCNNLRDKHIKNIYKLLHLKYLTLGSSVRRLSDEIGNLHCLETLDLRKTKIETLPVEVISLPHLAHLFGKIKLNKLSRKKLDKLLSGECNLETLSGVVVERNSPFPELMERMKKLTKVKIWCVITSTDGNYTKLSDAIRKFAQAGMDTSQGARSLSLHLNGSSKDLVQLSTTSRQAGSAPLVFYLSSLKLHGRLSHFKEFAKALSGLRELCLTCTNLEGPVLLACLRGLWCLVYLKLVEDRLDDLDINLDGDLASLQRLCIVVKQSKFPTIAQGALPGLVSLHMLCKDLVGLCDDIKVECFRDLREVALDSEVNQGTIELWENKAKEHPKRPKVLLLKRVEAADTWSAAKYVATDQRPSMLLVQGTP
ncbi:putative disease resistance protein RXW24L [Triticum urartu]|uniref:Putative disease resistance protein RXW24L n=1 Tax=Triticum urartu TaxID=4572 RepID=M7ZXL9_TRIUA|nr:putative disease resistance protein RXW24L [Triticum urartu]